jgi:hypothetical protein
MLSVTVRVAAQAPHESVNGYDDVLDPDALGFFLGLVPLSTTTALYRRLLLDCDIDESLLPEEQMEVADESVGLPVISMDFLGISDSTTALLATSFIGVMLMTAQGDDAETEMLYSLLADIANVFPETIQMTYVTLSTSFVFYLTIHSLFTGMRVCRTESKTYSPILLILPSSAMFLKSFVLRWTTVCVPVNMLTALVWVYCAILLQL